MFIDHFFHSASFSILKKKFFQSTCSERITFHQQIYSWGVGKNPVLAKGAFHQNSWNRKRCWRKLRFFEDFRSTKTFFSKPDQKELHFSPAILRLRRRAQPSIIISAFYQRVWNRKRRRRNLNFSEIFHHPKLFPANWSETIKFSISKFTAEA